MWMCADPSLHLSCSYVNFQIIFRVDTCVLGEGNIVRSIMLGIRDNCATIGPSPSICWNG